MKLIIMTISLALSFLSSCKTGEESTPHTFKGDFVTPKFTRDILNKKKKLPNGTFVQKKDEKPIAILRADSRWASGLDSTLLQGITDKRITLDAINKNDHARANTIRVIDKTTQDAVVTSDQDVKIALNFANEHDLLGNPNLYYDWTAQGDGTVKNYREGGPAKAQEEMITLVSDLTLTHRFLIDREKQRTKENIRRFLTYSFTKNGLVYLTENIMFGTQKSLRSKLELIETPVAFTMITAAALIPKEAQLAEAYTDMAKRIYLVLKAAQYKVSTVANNKTVELILGAFGCGAFISGFADKNAYANKIASLFKKALEKPEFQNLADVISFAIPTRGDKYNSKEFSKVFN